MLPVSFEQGSTEWLKWRMGGLGASDAVVVMGASPWKSRKELWREKVSQTTRDFDTSRMKRGRDLEPIARAEAEVTFQRTFAPGCFECVEHPFIKASLDGFSDDGLILEIKCPGEADHKLAMNGKVPPKYEWQLLHQMLVMKTDRVCYYSYDGQAGKAVWYQRDEEKAQMLLDELCSFWDCVLQKKEPTLHENDVHEVTNPLWLADAKRLVIIENQIRQLNEEKAALKNALITHGPEHKRVKGGGITLTRCMRAGQIDYSLVPSLKSIDLNAYRKQAQPAYYFQIEQVNE